MDRDTGSPALPRATGAGRFLDEAPGAAGAAPRRAATRPSRWPGVLVSTVAIAGAVALGLGLLGTPPPDAPLPAPFAAASGPAGPAADPSRPALQPADIGPDELWIPSLSIKAPLVEGDVVAVDGGRTLQIPADPQRITRYAGGASPCSTTGTMLLAGHVSSHGEKGALYPVSEVSPNALAIVGCADGTVSRWQVTSVQVVPKAELPQEIFTAAGPPRLVLVTCGGPVLANGHYRDNVLVQLRPAT